MITLTATERLNLVKHSTGQAARAFPTSLKLALFSSDTGLDDGAPTSELSSAATRHAITFIDGANTNAITFTNLIAGTVTHFGIYDNLGALVFWGNAATPFEVTSSGIARVSVGAISAGFTSEVDGILSAYACDKALKHFTGESAWAAPVSMTANLHTAFTGVDNGTPSHPTDLDYAGLPVSFSGTKNLAAEWPPAEAAWLNIEAISFDDELGNIVWCKQFPLPLTVEIGKIFIIPANAVTLEITAP